MTSDNERAIEALKALEDASHDASWGDYNIPSIISIIRTALQRDDSVVEEMARCLQAVLDWHKSISDYQRPLLANGSLEDACNNWDVATDVKVLDMEPLERVISKFNASRGKK